MQNPLHNPRYAAVLACVCVIERGMSLPKALLETSITLTAENKALCQELAYGILRYYYRYQVILRLFLNKPIKDLQIELIIMSGLYQLSELRIPSHAAIFETVNLVKLSQKTWAVKLVNAVLRRWQREGDRYESDHLDYRYAMPPWLLGKIKKAWPTQWETILEAANQKPFFEVRVNTQKTTRQAYEQGLIERGIGVDQTICSLTGIRLLKPIQVNEMPYFDEGLVSVQAIGAQWAAILLDVEEGQSILDACAAPGGKTIHLLEQANQLDLIAMDIDESRLEKVRENLMRTGYQARLMVGDVTNLPKDISDKKFDRILFDAPCSATGVIARHPDIKHLRRPDDFAALHATQLLGLKNLYRLLSLNGILLYSTCSIIPAENDGIIAEFLAQEPSAKIMDIDQAFGEKTRFGRQILPNHSGIDGFYYAKLIKNSLTP